MENKRTFDFQRLFLLIRSDVEMHASMAGSSIRGARGKTVSLTMLILGAALGFVFWVSTYNGQASFDKELADFVHGAAILTIMCAGWFITTLAFREIHNSEKSCGWLTLPGSLLEKFLAKVALTSIGYASFAVVAYGLIVACLMASVALLPNQAFVSFRPFDDRILDYIAYYLVLHSLHIVGGIIFKDLAYWRTHLTLWIFLCGGAMVLSNLATNHGITHNSSPLMAAIWVAVRIIFWGPMAPALLVLGYHLLKRKEA